MLVLRTTEVRVLGGGFVGLWASGRWAAVGGLAPVALLLAAAGLGLPLFSRSRAAVSQSVEVKKVARCRLGPSACAPGPSAPAFFSALLANPGSVGPRKIPHSPTPEMHIFSFGI